MFFKYFSRQILFTRTFEDSPVYSSTCTFQACANPVEQNEIQMNPSGWLCQLDYSIFFEHEQCSEIALNKQQTAHETSTVVLPK